MLLVFKNWRKLYSLFSFSQHHRDSQLSFKMFQNVHSTRHKPSISLTHCSKEHAHLDFANNQRAVKLLHITKLIFWEAKCLNFTPFPVFKKLISFLWGPQWDFSCTKIRLLKNRAHNWYLLCQKKFSYSYVAFI
jgi:hypothetical protein